MSYEAEKAVIGCLLLNNDTAAKVAGTLTPEMFRDVFLSECYRASMDCYENETPIDMAVLSSKIKDEQVPKMRLLPLLAECADAVTVSEKIDHYAKIVMREYKARKLGELLNHTRPDAETIDNQITELAELIEALNADRDGESVTIENAVDLYSKGRFNGERELGINLGYEKFDSYVNGLWDGEMVVIAARPAVGKSAFVSEIALNMAKSGKRVSLFNLEMTAEQVYERMVAHESGISVGRIRNATSFRSPDEARAFDDGNDALRGLKDLINIYDSITKVSKMAANAKSDNADIVIIDYLQLITPESSYRGNRTAEVGQISHAIKKQAKKLKIPFVVLAQLNRVSTMANDKEPSMSELRESGDIEQDADKIILLWNADDDRKTKGIKIDKNRQGECGKQMMEFDGSVMRFREIDDSGMPSGFSRVAEDDDSPFD